MTFDEFKEKLITKFGEGNVSFRETGKNGWSRIEDVDPFTVSHGNKGPHYCDASPCGTNPVSRQKLLGTYDYNSSKETFYVDVNTTNA